jgi:hypothetical protein
LYGFINEKGREIVPLQYGEANDFSEGLAAVENDTTGAWGFVNGKGREVISLKYQEVYNFQNHLAAVRDSTDSWGFIDANGKIIFPCKYDTPVNGGFDENGLCEINQNGFIDIHGTEYWEDPI